MARFVKVRDWTPSNGDGLTRWVDVTELFPPDVPLPAGRVRDDPDPTLTANLKLNGFGLNGELDDQTLLIDGGLL